MDEISVESSDSSSCSSISYEGSQGYISDGQDPLIEPIDLSSEDDEIYIEDDLQSVNSFQGPEEDYQQKKRKKEQKAQEKQIINELKYGRNTVRLLNRNPLIPTYQEIMKTLKKIKEKFPNRSLQSIISKLHLQLIERPKEASILKKKQEKQSRHPRPASIPFPEQKQKWSIWIKKRKVAAESFVQLGYGIKLMKKFIISNDIKIQIDMNTYADLIEKILKDAYLRLQRFLRKKCHKRVVAITNAMQDKILIQLLKNCTKKSSKFDSFEVRNFSKLIKPTYIKNRTFKLSKRIASRLYHTCKSLIAKKKLSRGQLSLDNPDCDIYNNDKDKWTSEMAEKAVDLYISEGNEGKVQQVMRKTCDIEGYLLDSRNIKYHIGCKVREGLKIVIQCLKNIKKQDSPASKTKEMVDLDNSKLSELINHIDAANVRILLCEVYKAKDPSVILLNQTVLAVNEFILKRQNEKMLQEIKKTDRQFNPNENNLSRRRRRQK